ncbi:MAG TPA: hypothetical protein VGL05_19335 [Kribbella sp.]
MNTQPDLRTPTEWAKLEDCLILDADGWNGRDAKPFDEPITQAEYERRRAISTCRFPASYDQAEIDRLAAKRAAEDAAGLEHRYHVQRLNDDSGKHTNCRYFVLDPQHDQFARVALWHYATACEPTNAPLARDLTAWLNRVTPMDQDANPHPAGEHHTGTLNLAGQGNPEPASPISDEIVQIAEQAYETFGAGMQDALEAAYPAIRQHVAEQIAAALDAVPAQAYPEDIFPPDGTSIDCQSARVMRFAYPAAANIAREIGGAE